MAGGTDRASPENLLLLLKCSPLVLEEFVDLLLEHPEVHLPEDPQDFLVLEDPADFLVLAHPEDLHLPAHPEDLHRPEDFAWLPGVVAGAGA